MNMWNNPSSMRYWQNHTGSTYRPDRPAKKRDRILLQHRRIPARHQEQGQVPQNGNYLPLHIGLLGHYHWWRDVRQHHTGGLTIVLPCSKLSQWRTKPYYHYEPRTVRLDYRGRRHTSDADLSWSHHSKQPDHSAVNRRHQSVRWPN